MRGLRVAFLIAQLFLNGGASEEVDGRNDELAGAERASWRATACVVRAHVAGAQYNFVQPEANWRVAGQSLTSSRDCNSSLAARVIQVHCAATAGPAGLAGPHKNHNGSKCSKLTHSSTPCAICSVREPVRHLSRGASLHRLPGPIHSRRSICAYLSSG